jgi:hypothetical protein
MSRNRLWECEVDWTGWGPNWRVGFGVGIVETSGRITRQTLLTASCVCMSAKQVTPWTRVCDPCIYWLCLLLVKWVRTYRGRCSNSQLMKQCKVLHSRLAICLHHECLKLFESSCSTWSSVIAATVFSLCSFLKEIVGLWNSALSVCLCSTVQIPNKFAVLHEVSYEIVPLEISLISRSFNFLLSIITSRMTREFLQWERH